MGVGALRVAGTVHAWPHQSRQLAANLRRASPMLSAAGARLYRRCPPCALDVVAVSVWLLLPQVLT